NFFIQSATGALKIMGMTTNPFLLSVVLPVGLSFYTFQSMSYTIDVYRGEVKPSHRFWDFALFVAFFPQLVAGPISRAHDLLPQVLNPRRIAPLQVNEGLWLCLWGFFQKIVIADNAASLANPLFQNSSQLSGPQALLAIYAFALQIYGDFAGYSNIARGLAKLLGFELMNNFMTPYFSRNPAEFWRRWHISLSTWLRDYLYIPLGGNRGGNLFTYRNLMITMVLGGLWHGASWPFVLWGAYHGLILILHRLSQPLLRRAFGGSPSNVQAKPAPPAIRVLDSAGTLVPAMAGAVVAPSANDHIKIASPTPANIASTAAIKEKPSLKSNVLMVASIVV
ncbi:MAG: MBOAT family protein, partial [Cytophagaceae bacterium]